MKRKLINYDVFERIEQDSLSSAQQELVEASQLVAKALGATGAELYCFGNENVVYETTDGSFIHANYSIKDDQIILDNIEQLVIDEQTAKTKSREVLSNLVDALLEDDNKRADSLFSEYLTMPATKKVFSEEKKLRAVPIRKDGKIVGYRKARWQTTPRKREASNKTIARMKAKKINSRKRPASTKNLLKMRRDKVRKTIGEWTNLCENVFNYLDIKEYGPVLRESLVQQDNRGNVVSVQIPNKKLRNEAKLLSFNWKTLNTDVVVKRGNAKKVNEDADFVRAILNLKRHNALSDGTALEEALENIVTKWPSVLYLTQPELAESIKVALESSNATNYDDQTCDFMAEGILRVAHNAFVDRVGKIVKLAGANIDENAEDKYAAFQIVASKFYKGLDESNRLEMQVFVDLYEALRQVHKLAGDEGNKLLQNEVATHLENLLPVIQMEVEPSLELAESAADWLWELIETNLETQDWDVSNTPHITTNGDHPQMTKNAKVGYAPSSDFSGDWGDSAPVSDGKNYTGADADEMRNRSWSNIGGDGVYPSLQNPYVPASFGDYKISGEKTIDGDSDQLAHVGGSDTWPSLQNPYVPAGVTPQSYKMKNGPETDLVVDK